MGSARKASRSDCYPNLPPVLTVAQRVDGILTSSGYDSQDRVAHGFIWPGSDPGLSYHQWRYTGRSHFTPEKFRSGDFFISEPDGEEAVVGYFGPVAKEADRLRLYRLAVENCSFLVSEEDDPQREGRRRLRVARP